MLRSLLLIEGLQISFGVVEERWVLRVLRSHSISAFLHFSFQNSELKKMLIPCCTLISSKTQRTVWKTENLNHKHNNKNFLP